MEVISLLTDEPLVVAAVKNKIKSFITPDLYRDLEDFIKDNPTFEEFKKRAKFNEAYRRALNWDAHNLTEEEYQQILEDLRAELENKMKIEKDKISTVSAHGKEVVTYQKDDGTVIAVDNSYSDKSIQEQLDEIQDKYSRFRTNGETNTDEIMAFVQNEVKPEATFQSADAIDTTTLNSDDSQIVAAAQAYQDTTDEPISVNLDDGLILDQGQVLEVKPIDGEMQIIAADEIDEDQKKTKKTKAKQKVLKRETLKEAGFSDAILISLLSGMLLGMTLFIFF